MGQSFSDVTVPTPDARFPLKRGSTAGVGPGRVS